jgi:membrane protease YdiL (CAAX protease family)
MLVAIFAFGLALGWTREKPGSLLLPITAHVGANLLAVATLPH